MGAVRVGRPGAEGSSMWWSVGVGARVSAGAGPRDRNPWVFVRGGELRSRGGRGGAGRRERRERSQEARRMVSVARRRCSM